jgi:hypothetical protein
MRYITGVEYEGGYVLRLSFDNGEMRTVDLESCLEGEMFEPLRDERVFATAKLNPDIDTVV